MVLDTTHDRAIDLMLGSALTTQPVDNAKVVLLLRATNGDPVIRQMILAKRTAWRTRLTLTQRKWQSKPRTISDVGPRGARALTSSSSIVSLPTGAWTRTAYGLAKLRR